MTHKTDKPASDRVFKAIVLLWLAFALLQPAALSARDVIATGNATTWHYLDNGQEPPAAWREITFDDSAWKSGPAPLGYGRPRLGTETGWSTNTAAKFITTWFRHEFDRPELKPDERLILSFCVDDGAVIYLNGHELGRANLPDGPLMPNTLAPHAIDGIEEGFYLRMPVSVGDLQPGHNVFAVEVHQCSPKSHDLFLDFALKTLPPEKLMFPVPASAMTMVEQFLKHNYLGPESAIPDGFTDGGHAMKFTGNGTPVSGREILLVDRTNDVGLAKDLAFARSPELQSLPPLERAQRVATYIDQEMTPPGGRRLCDPTCAQLEKEFANQPIYLGDWVDQGHAGVCRHRSLLFKILADAAGLKVALVRGHLVLPSIPNGGQHAWNELFLDDGRRLLVDVTNMRSPANYQEVTASAVADHYRKHDNSPWYTAATNNGPTK